TRLSRRFATSSSREHAAGITALRSLRASLAGSAFVRSIRVIARYGTGREVLAKPPQALPSRRKHYVGAKGLTVTCREMSGEPRRGRDATGSTGPLHSSSGERALVACL